MDAETVIKLIYMFITCIGIAGCLHMSSIVASNVGREKDILVNRGRRVKHTVFLILFLVAGIAFSLLLVVAIDNSPLMYLGGALVYTLVWFATVVSGHARGAMAS